MQTLIKRRDAIERAYLTSVNPVVDPTLDDAGVLRFGNAALGTDLVRAPTSYRGTWYLFDNATGEVSQTLGRTEGSEPCLPSPSTLPKADAFVRIDISADSAAQPEWAASVHVYFHRESAAWRLVGLERTTGDAPMRDVGAPLARISASARH